MIHGICLPSYDTIFPLSAESALSSTITGFVSLHLASYYLINSMNKLVQAVWIHTLWTVQTEITCTSYITEEQPTSACSCSLTFSKHSQITNRKPTTPINQILFLWKPFPKTQLYIQQLGDVTVCAERLMTERKEWHHLKSQLRLCQFCNKGVALCSDLNTGHILLRYEYVKIPPL